MRKQVDLSEIDSNNHLMQKQEGRAGGRCSWRRPIHPIHSINPIHPTIQSDPSNPSNPYIDFVFENILDDIQM